MKLLSRIGGSIALLYLACVLFAVAGIGLMPAALSQAHAQSSVPPVEVVEVTPVAEDVATEAAKDESVVTEVADKIPDWLEIVSSLIALASAAAAFTPSPKDNAVLIVVRKVVDVLALNLFAAKNAAAVDAERKADSQLGKR